MHCLVIAGAQHSTSWMLSDSLELSGLVPLTARVAPFLTRRQQGRKSAQRPLLGQAWSLSQETPDRCDYHRQYPRRGRKASVANLAITIGNGISILTQACPTGGSESTPSRLVKGLTLAGRIQK